MATTENESAFDVIWHYFRAALITTALAPAVGSYILIVSAGSLSAGPGQSLGWALFSIPLSMAGWGIAYRLMAVPAFFSGIFYAATIRIIFKGRPPNFFIRALVGAFLGFGSIYLFQLIIFGFDGALVWIGACTGAFITVFIKRLA
ncbi:hypothetical protein [Pseudomonas sp. AG1028]|uniref:hypothetical protein n=1 Tax=Pseudomonas sp. AG1028 TaxID=2572911 RepID=UPI0011BE4F04|nr:hypothetical protein [Pseudomonas sp. AG1028]